MKILSTLLICLIACKAFCCSCAPVKPFEKLEDLKNYNFIALATIKKLSPQGDSWNGRQSGDIDVEILEQFKGEKVNQITDPGFNSSCAMSFNEGEQWLFFGNQVNGKVSTGMCTYSTIYRYSDGKREWRYFVGLKQLATLRNIFASPIVVNAPKIFYPDGSVEIEQAFKKGKLDGVRKIFFPNGKLYVKEEFKLGVRVGTREIYNERGNMVSTQTYKNGLSKSNITYMDSVDVLGEIRHRIAYSKLWNEPNRKRDSMRYIKSLDSLRLTKNWNKQVQSMTNYSDKGLSYESIVYDFLGIVQNKRVQNWKKQTNQSYTYRKDGTLEYTVLNDNKNNKQIEYDYKEDGSRRDFVGKCDACYIYFDKSNPVKDVEKIYIQ